MAPTPNQTQGLLNRPTWKTECVSERQLNRYDICTNTNTFTVIVRATDGTFCIVDVVRGQWSPSKRDTVILETARRDGPAVNVGIEEEPGSAGKHQSEHLIRLLAGFSVKAVRPSGPKEVRARPLAAQMEAGNVTLLRSPWNGALVDEFCSFPGGAHDDQVDAAAGAFNALTLGLFDWTGQEEARDDNRSLVSQAPPGVFLT